MKAKRKESPAPQPGQDRRIPIPDSMDGIRFEIARIAKFIVEGQRDPLVLVTAHKIAELSLDAARQAGGKLAKEPNQVSWLRGIHAWGREHFLNVPNPSSVEVIKTPGRMLRELEIPEEFARAFWEPIRDAIAKAAGRDPAELKLPKPRITGSSGVAVCLGLSLAAALGLGPLRMRMGGHGEALHHVWGNVWAGGRYYDVDLMLPKFGEFERFDTYALVDVPQ